MDGLRRFIKTDNHNAVDVGYLRRGIKSDRVQSPQFTKTFPEAAVREGTDEQTLLPVEVGTQRTFITTEHTEFERWEPPLVDED